MANRPDLQTMVRTIYIRKLRDGHSVRAVVDFNRRVPLIRCDFFDRSGVLYDIIHWLYKYDKREHKNGS